eukprot:3289890-Pleurochrysis_carterae.AAC.2
MVKTGPKISSRHAELFRSWSEMMVGVIKYPSSQPGTARRSPPQSTVHPSDWAERTARTTLCRRSAEMSGPISVSASRGSPTRSAVAASTSSSVTRGAMGSCSSSRLVAEHTCPAFEKMPSFTHSMSDDTSASSNATSALFPPSSSEAGLHTANVHTRPGQACTRQTCHRHRRTLHAGENGQKRCLALAAKDGRCDCVRSSSTLLGNTRAGRLMHSPQSFGASVQQHSAGSAASCKADAVYVVTLTAPSDTLSARPRRIEALMC